MTSPVIIAQLTDTHIVEPESDETLYVDHNDRLAQAVASINAEQPTVDVVVGTGDLTQWGQPGEFDQLAELLAPLAAPFLPLPGNHDERAAMRSCFPHHEWSDHDHLSWVTDVGDVRIIGLDTTVPGHEGGMFDNARADWLGAMLAQPHAGQTLLAMHHPPFPSGIEWMDRSGLEGADRFAAVLATHPVGKVLCGHLHRPISTTVGGIPVEVGLATSVHVALDLDGDAPRRVVRDPAGYRLHVVTGGTVVSHTRYVDTGEAPFEPDWLK